MNLLKRLIERLIQPAPPAPADDGLAAPGPEARRLVLEELRNVLARQSETGDVLDGKLKELLGTAGLIITLVTALQVATASTSNRWALWVLVVALVLLVAMVIIVLKGLGPTAYNWPVPTGQDVADCSTRAAADKGWDEIARRFLPLGEAKALDLLISNHLVCINKNHRPLKSKVLYVKITLGLLVSIIVILVASGMAILATQ